MSENEQLELLSRLTPGQWRQVKIRRVSDFVHFLTMVNKKGGSGKTTTTVTLAGIFAMWGARVRIKDGDPQLASATYWLPPQADNWQNRTLLEVFQGTASLDEVTYPTSIPNISIVPSLENLGSVEYERPPGSDLIVREELAGATEVDLNMGDLAPAMGVVTVAMLGAATDIMLTMKASGLDFVGKAEIERPISIVRKRINPELRMTAVTLVDTDENTLISRQLTAQVASEHPEALISTVPHSVRASEAPMTHQPLFEYAPDNPVSLAYCRLAAMLVPKLGFEWVVSPADVVKAA
jgi:chromosome partitioning protein